MKLKLYFAPEAETIELSPYEEICNYGGGIPGDNIPDDDVEIGGSF